MNLLAQLNRAMNYIEANMCNDIELAHVSSVTSYSPYHFGRIFYYIAEMPLSEYIRKRKLSLAAMDLQSSSLRVIDLAVKYGYDSADSFTRAFVKQHGLTPSAARKAGAMLKIFPSLTFQIKIQGVKEMNWRIEEKEAFKVLGIERYFKNDESDDIPEFWTEVKTDGSCDRLVKQANSSGLMGMCGHIDDRDDEFPYMICVYADANTKTGGFKLAEVPKTTWAIFRSDEMETNARGLEVPGLFKRAYSEWLPSSGYDKASSADMEIYGVTDDGKYYEEVWIPVVKNK